VDTRLVDHIPKVVRKYVYDYFLEATTAPSLEEIMRELKLARREALEALVALESAKQLALLRGTERILMAFPFSAIATPFKVSLANGKKYFANCAWDAVAFHVMLEKGVRIDSFCHHCTERIEILLNRGRPVKMDPSNPLVFIAVPAHKWWEDIVSSCSNAMFFFSSKDHLQGWLTDNPEVVGQAITVEQTLKISAPIYGGRMEVDYERPSREVIEAQFESAGLRGDFWKL